MPHCCAFGCKGDNVMHSFPNPSKFPERFKAWVNLVGDKLKSLSDNDIYKKKRICDIHFTQEHHNRFKRLNALAMPTLYLPGQSATVPVQQSETRQTLTVLPSTSTSGESHGVTVPVQQSETGLSCTVFPSTSTSGESHGVTVPAQQSETSLNFTVLPSTSNQGEHYAVTGTSATTQQFGAIGHQSNKTSTLATPTSDDSAYSVATNYVMKEHNYGEISKPREKQLLKDAHAVNLDKIKIRSLQTKVKYLRNEICRLRKKGRSYRERLEHAEKISNEVAFKQVTKNMSEAAQMFLHMQLQSKKKTKGRRFSIEEKVMGLSLFKTSPECYRMLCHYITMPSEKAIKRFLNEIQ